MILQKFSALLSIALGSFLLIFVGGKLILQILAIVVGLIFIFKGFMKLGMCKMKATMNNFCDL